MFASLAAVLVLAAAPAAGRPAPPAGRAILGPWVVPSGDGAVVLWLEEPKTLVQVALDARGRRVGRTELALPEPDAPIEQLEPMVLADGQLAVAYLESGVRRLVAGRTVELRRVVVRFLDDREPSLQIVTEERDDDSGQAPGAIVGAGLYTSSHLPAVLWRRQGSDPTAAERRPGPVVLSILRANGSVTHSDILGDGRSATAVAWRIDGAAFVAGTDAGRPFVVGPDGETPIDVPTPALVASMVTPYTTSPSWTAAGLDATGRLFVVTGSLGLAHLRRFVPAEEALVDEQPDAADFGRAEGPPVLLQDDRGEGLILIWPASVGRGRARHHELRARAFGGGGAAARASAPLLACPAGAAAVGYDAAVLPGGALAAAVTCARDGSASVSWVVSPSLP